MDVYSFNALLYLFGVKKPGEPRPFSQEPPPGQP